MRTTTSRRRRQKPVSRDYDDPRPRVSRGVRNTLLNRLRGKTHEFEEYRRGTEAERIRLLQAVENASRDHTNAQRERASAFAKSTAVRRLARVKRAALESGVRLTTQAQADRGVSNEAAIRNAVADGEAGVKRVAFRRYDQEHDGEDGSWRVMPSKATVPGRSRRGGGNLSAQAGCGRQ